MHMTRDMIIIRHCSWLYLSIHDKTMIVQIINNGHDSSWWIMIIVHESSWWDDDYCLYTRQFAG